MGYNQWVRVAAFVAVLLCARAVHAEGEQALSASLGWATFSVPGKPMRGKVTPTLTPDVGGVLAVSYERAISTDLSLRAEAAGGVFRGGNEAMEGRTSYAALGDAGVVFRFDVLTIVPYAFGGLGGAMAGGGPIDRSVDLVLVAGAGVDWLRGRTRSYGVEARVASFGGDVTVITAGLRGTLRWGFF